MSFNLKLKKVIFKKPFVPLNQTNNKITINKNGYYFTIILLFVPKNIIGKTD